MRERDAERGDERFSTTHWSLLRTLADQDRDERAGSPEGSGQQAALEELCRTYWPPVYAAVRRMGKSTHDALELTQGFFATVVLGRRLFERADPARGRLRSLLLASLKRYVVDVHRETARPKRFLPIGGAEIAAEEHATPADGSLDPESAFDRRWAALLLSEALRRVETDLCRCGYGTHWRAFELFVVQPTVHGATRPSYLEIAEALGFEGVKQVATAIQVTKRRLKLAIEHAVAETVSADQSELDDEVRWVLGLLER